MTNSICGCGTLEKAMEKMLKMHDDKTLANDGGMCPLWLMQLTMALNVITEQYYRQLLHVQSMSDNELDAYIHGIRMHIMDDMSKSERIARMLEGHAENVDGYINTEGNVAKMDGSPGMIAVDLSNATEESVREQLSHLPPEVVETVISQLQERGDIPKPTLQ